MECCVVLGVGEYWQENIVCKVLVVEDEVLICLILVDVLYEVGFDVLDIGLVEYVIEIINEQMIYLFFIDIQLLGKLMGFDFVYRVFECFFDVGIIVVLGWIQLMSMDLLFVVKFFLKLFGFDEIIVCFKVMNCFQILVVF